jgi:predicted DsbA family dithiol-disulfide isomerase
MKEKLKIDIVSDVVCPWCTVGYKRLEKAISELGVEDQVEIEWQPFQLNPFMPVEGQNLREHLTEKYGSSEEQFNAMQQQMVDAGNEVGFTFDYFDEMRMANTFEAHVLLEYAKEFNKQTELKLRLTTAFFSERKDISDLGVLAQALKDVGLNEEEGMARLKDNAAHEHVKETEAHWKSLGVNSVPTIVFNRKSAVTGAQPVDIFKQVLSEELNLS